MSDSPPPQRIRRAVVVYAFGWLCVGAVTATALILVLRGYGDQELPPLRQTTFSSALRAGGCRVAHVDDRRPGNPPASGAALARPAAPGVYSRPLPAAAIIAALRRGVVVLQYRATVDKDRVKQLQAVHRRLPRTVIVAPNGTRMPYVVVAAGWRRLLGCRRFTDATLDALRLFGARRIGRGPDAPVR